MTDSDNNTVKMDEPSAHSCQHCNRIFKTFFRMKRHVYMIHFKPTCTACSNSFERMRELKQHALDSHELKMNKMCSLCKKAYSTKQDLETHVKEDHEKDKASICVKCQRIFFDEERLKAHMMAHSGGRRMRMRSFQCSDCNTTFPSTFQLNKHLRAGHNGATKTLQCPECGEHFQASEELRKRMCEMHLGAESKPPEKSFVCKYCDEAFATPGNVNRHIRSNHADKRPFKCQDCPFIFETEEELQLHATRRHATRKFQCELCRRRFWQEDALKKHLRNDHNVNDSENGDEKETSSGEGENEQKEVMTNGVDHDAPETVEAQA